MTQEELGIASEMKQARISALERVGSGNFSIETLIRLASALRVGLSIRFVQMSEMLAWENEFEPDHFEVAPIEKDEVFLRPGLSQQEEVVQGALVSAMSGTTVQDVSPSIALSRIGPSSDGGLLYPGSLANRPGGTPLPGMWPMAESKLERSKGTAA